MNGKRNVTNIKSIDNCVICQSNKLNRIFSLEKIFLTGYFPNQSESDLISTPITLNLCSECNNVQMQEKVNPENMFRNYWYRSSTTQTMKSHLKSIINSHGVKQGKLFDIGCNDGTLLEIANSYGMEVYGIDPSNAVRDIPNQYKEKVFNQFFSLEFCEKNLQDLYGSFDLITVISIFYDVSEPIEFLTGIKLLLKDTGKAIIEVNYAKDFFEKKNVDMLGQEHLIYYFIKTFGIIAGKVGLFVNHAYLTEMNGGNITFIISKKDSGKSKELLELIESEKNWMQEFQFDYFEALVKKEFMLFRKWLQKKSQTSVIKILGASTRGALISQMLMLDSQIITAAVDLQLNKKGRLMPGTDIIIEYDPEHIPPDSYLVMPYQFKTEIVKRYTSFLQNGGELIFYRPTFCQVTYNHNNMMISEESLSI